MIRPKKELSYCGKYVEIVLLLRLRRKFIMKGGFKSVYLLVLFRKFFIK